MDKYGIIYTIRNKINGKIYVGQTTNKRGFRGRYSRYGEGIARVYRQLNSCKNNNSIYNIHLLRSIEKYGFDAFEVDEEFDIAYSKEELDKLEDMYIKIYDCIDNGYNQKEGGANGKFSEEARKRLSEKNLGEGNGFYGKHHTEEAKQKMSESKKEMYKGEGHPRYGKHLSEETKNKISNSLKGNKLSEETRKKISQSNKGRTMSEENKQKLIERNTGGNNPQAKPIYCEELQEVRLSGSEWARELGISNVAISNCCRGKSKTSGGYHWRYATEEEIKEYKLKHDIDQ